MTKEDAAKIWPVLKAFAEGQDVEIFCKKASESKSRWHLTSEVKVNEGYDFPYRVKPAEESKYNKKFYVVSLPNSYNPKELYIWGQQDVQLCCGDIKIHFASDNESECRDFINAEAGITLEKDDEWIYMKDINSDEEFDKHKGGKLYVWKVKITNDKGRVEFEGFHTGTWGDLVYETYAYQVECFKKIEPPKE